MWSPCCKLFYIKIGSEDFKSRFSIEFYKEDRYIFGGNIFFKARCIWNNYYFEITIDYLQKQELIDIMR